MRTSRIYALTISRLDQFRSRCRCPKSPAALGEPPERRIGAGRAARPVESGVHRHLAVGIRSDTWRGHAEAVRERVRQTSLHLMWSVPLGRCGLGASCPGRAVGVIPAGGAGGAETSARRRVTSLRGPGGVGRHLVRGHCRGYLAAGSRGVRSVVVDGVPAWLPARRIVPRIARRGIQSSARLGRHRWAVNGL